MIRVAINGFGMIGRQEFKVWFDKHQDAMQIVVNGIEMATYAAKDLSKLLWKELNEN